MDKSPQVAPRTIWANKSQLRYWIAQGSPFERYCTDILYLHRWSWHKLTYPAQYTRSDNNPHGHSRHLPQTHDLPSKPITHQALKGRGLSFPYYKHGNFAKPVYWCQTRPTSGTTNNHTPKYIHVYIIHEQSLFDNSDIDTITPNKPICQFDQQQF